MRETTVSLQVFLSQQNFPFSLLLKHSLIPFFHAVAVFVEDLVFGLNGIHTMSNPSLFSGHYQVVSSNIWSMRMDILKGRRFGIKSVMSEYSLSIMVLLLMSLTVLHT